MNGQTLYVYSEFDGEPVQDTLTLEWVDYTPSVTITETDNYVTITSTTADTIQYRIGSSGEYTSYTEPVYIETNGTIYVTATRTVSNVDYTANESQAVTHTYLPPSNLTITCALNVVSISADYAQTIEYNFDGSSSYTTYTEPFEITETVTVYAKATNVDGSITGSQECKLDNRTIPFYIEDISGSANTIRIKGTASRGPSVNNLYKSNDRVNWSLVGSISGTSYLDITIPANSKVYLRSTSSYWGNSSAYVYFQNPTGNFNVGGNIMSLLFNNNFEQQTNLSSKTYCFKSLFYGNTKLVSAGKLVLPATTLANYCYQNMFDGCSSLTTAPSILPATTLTEGCYRYMFNGCTALTTAPALPATTLIQYCYYNMFYGCTALTTAPALPATTLIQYCYYNMFYGCTNLNRIECLATNISALNCTVNWVANVAATGTFIKNPSMSSWTTGSSAIPLGWTVEDAAE